MAQFFLKQSWSQKKEARPSFLHVGHCIVAGFAHPTPLHWGADIAKGVSQKTKKIFYSVNNYRYRDMGCLFGEHVNCPTCLVNYRMVHSPSLGQVLWFHARNKMLAPS